MSTRGIEIGQGLVEQEHLGLAHDGAADGDALALAAGKLAGLALEQMLHLEDAGGLADLPVADIPGRTGELQPEPDIVVNAHMRIERVVLEHHGDAPVARLDMVAQHLADPQFARRNLLEARDHAQKRGLAAARGADKDDELAMVDAEVDPLDDLDIAIALVERSEGQSGHGIIL